jgi:hypothetical protein
MTDAIELSPEAGTGGQFPHAYVPFDVPQLNLVWNVRFSAIYYLVGSCILTDILWMYLSRSTDDYG